MNKKNPSLLKLLSYCPWWVSVIAGITVYVSLTYLIPSLSVENNMLLMFTEVGKNAAIWLSLLFLLPAITSLFRAKKRKQLVNHQKSIETLKETSWRDFEVLVGEVFRRRGFTVQENISAGADGGIDLLLLKDGEQHIVQCKQWRKSKVGVSVVREMFGVLKASSAKSIYIVSSGHFTKEANHFAANQPITLIDGNELVLLIIDMQDLTKLIDATQTSNVDKCPKCESELIKRVAKKGSNTGNEFLGCSSFPKCRYIAP